MTELVSVPIVMQDEEDTTRPSDAPEWPKRAWVKKRLWYGRCPIGGECGRNMCLLWKLKPSKDKVCELMYDHLMATSADGRKHATIIQAQEPAITARALVETHRDDEHFYSFRADRYSDLGE